MNKSVLNRVAERCYIPANNIILQEIDHCRDENITFKVSFSISGVFLEQCEMWRSDVIESFRHLADTGNVELLCQTYYHSLASLYQSEWSEFEEQIKMHQQIIRDFFGKEPETFENTECIYNNEIAKRISDMGFKTIITEGIEKILGWRSPNYVYKAKNLDVKILFRNYRLSDDIGFRFSSPEWDQWPLTAEKYAYWLASTPGDIITIFLDYETFGEHYWKESGILEFLRWLPKEVEKHDNLSWCTPSEASSKIAAVDEVDVSQESTISWADDERDISAWLGNDLQKIAFNLVRTLENDIKNLNDHRFLKLWRYLQTSDHFYYMSTKSGGSGIVHRTFNPYGDPAESFTTFIMIASDLNARCQLELRKLKYKSKMILRKLPERKGFIFFSGFARQTGFIAYSLEEFYVILKKIDLRSIWFHLKRGDFERWLRHVIGDTDLANFFSSLKCETICNETLRNKILKKVKRRISDLKSVDVSLRSLNMSETIIH